MARNHREVGDNERDLCCLHPSKMGQNLNGDFCVPFLAGSILRKHLLHSHYSGTVQVMKAVGNHLVLTFCERTELFTIILTRTKNAFAIDVSTNIK